VTLFPRMPEPVDKEVHRFRPAHRLENATLAPPDHGSGAATMTVVRYPAVLTLWSEMTEIHGMVSDATYPYDGFVLDRDLQSAAVRA